MKIPVEQYASRCLRMQPKLGILAGGGPLPKYLADHCQFIGREYCLVAFKGHAEFTILNQMPDLWTRLGAAGKIIQALKDQEVQEIVMVGPVRRPSIITLFPDWYGIKFLVRVGSRARKGDNSLLAAIAEELEWEGFRIVGIDELLEDLVAPDGPFGKIEPEVQTLKFIQNGIVEALSLGQRDIGQAVVILNDEIIAVEDANGTDDLIRRCRNKNKNVIGPILVKVKKPDQDRRVDLPTIGTRTVQLAVECGFSGIVVEAGQTLVVNRPGVTRIADENGLFVIGKKLKNVL